MTKIQKILGVDPGTATTGYGIIESLNGKLSLVEFGAIKTSKRDSAAQRLGEIFGDLTSLITKHRPQVLAVEQLFFYKNITTAISVAEARGVVLLCAEQNKLKIAEFTPLQVKMSLTGYGKADKKQVQYMVAKLLGLKKSPRPDDAADALAVAICAAGRKY